jgi:predicted NBD/HSP70 family sugar kinase
MSSQRSAPARQSSLREHNLALVLGEVADGGPVSRARIAASTGLTKATVSSLVETLLEARLLAELGRSATVAVGRPASALALAPGGPVGIGVEINVDYVATCTVDLAGTVRQREVVVGDLRALPLSAVLGRAAGAVRRAVAGAAAPVAGVAVGVPGLVETGGRLVRSAPNLGWQDVPLLQELRDRADLPAELDLRLDNEANLAALGELWLGRHDDADGVPLADFVHVSGEVGVGAGVVLNGALLRGRHGFAGELGHTPVGGDDTPCRCGARGCLEQVAGQDAILRASGLPEPARPWPGGDDGPAVALASSAAAGDARTLGALERAGHALGRVLAGALNLLDVDTVVLGGAYARLAPWLCPPVLAELESRVTAARWRPVRVLPGRLGADAAVRGAATSVVRGVITAPAGYLGRA